MVSAGLALAIGGLLAAAPARPPPQVLDTDAVRAAFGYPPEGPDGRPYLWLNGFVPLGWSADGKLAYALELDTDPADCNVVLVHVQDLRDSRVLWRGSYGGAWGEASAFDDRVEVDASAQAPECHGQVGRIWGKYRARWSAVMKRFGVRPLARGEFRQGTKGPGFTLRVRESTQTRKDHVEEPFPVERTVERLLSDGSAQVLLHERCEDGACRLPRSTRVLGYVTSPDRRWAAVVLGELVSGWEGPPDSVELSVVGMALPARREQGGGQGAR